MDEPDRATRALLIVSAVLIILAAGVVAAELVQRSVARQFPSAAYTLFPGHIGLPSPDSTQPGTVLRAQWSGKARATDMFLSCLSAEFMTPVPASGLVSVFNGTVSSSALCDTFAAVSAASFNGWTAHAKPARVNTSLHAPVMGCSQARRQHAYVSPFLRMLQQHGFSSWTLMERNWQVGVLPGIPLAPCLDWKWTPLQPDSQGRYVIALQPSAGAPWTAAVIDFGSYFSSLPGADSSDITRTLVTSTGIAVYANASYYVTPKKSSELCVLGVAAVAWFSAAALDLARQRLGLLLTRIGSVESNPAPFVFA